MDVTPNYGFTIPSADGSDLMAPELWRTPLGQVDTKLLAMETGSGSAWTPFVTTWKCGAATIGIGNGTLVSRYRDVGKTRFWEILINRGSTTAVGVSGDYTWTLPAGAPQAASGKLGGFGYFRRASPFSEALFNVIGIGALTVTGLMYNNTRLTFNTIPWAVNDELNMWGFYELA